MHRLFSRFPEALARTLQIAERCRFNLEELAYQYPEERDDPTLTPQETLAKLTWDPDYDVQNGIEEFARASYGPAAPQIVAYVKMVTDRDTYFLVDRGRGIYDDLYGGHLAATPIKKDKLKEMDKLFDEAEQAVAGDPESLQRVKLVRLAVQYAILRYADKDDPLRAKARRHALVVAKEARVKDTDPFTKAIVGSDATD